MLPETTAERFDLAVLLDEQTLVLMGGFATGLPERAIVLPPEDDRRGSFRALTWAGESEPAGCIAVLRLDGVALNRPADLLLDAGDGSTRSLPGVARLELGPLAVVQALKRNAPHRLAACFDFLRLALLEGEESDPAGRARRFLHAFLHEISIQDGFVEIFGRPECGGLFLQGWSIHLPVGSGDLWIETEGLSAYPAVVGHFSRPDLLDTAHGMVAFMLQARDLDPSSIRRLYFRSKAGYHHLSIVDHPARFEAAEATRHVATMLPRIDAPIDIRGGFRRICRPRFEGQETLSTTHHPVRMAVDCSLHVADSGFFLTGWMLDPARVMSRLLLKSTAGFYARVDTGWARLPRPDVSQGFAADAVIGAKLRPEEHAHGYVVFVPREKPLAADERFYLEIVIQDEEAIFLPLALAEAGATAAIRDMLVGLDLDDPAVEQLIARHIAPTMAGIHAGRNPAVAPETIVEFGGVREPMLSVVMPLPTLAGDLDVWFARLAPDADTARAEIILVAPRAGSDRLIGRFRRLTEFYRLNGRLMLTAEALDRHEALELGARSAVAEHVLFLSPGVLPKDTGWMRRLLRDLKTEPRAGAISPTLTYEDYSIRYAGRDPDLGDAPNQPSDRARFIGYSKHWIGKQGVTMVGGITSECCLMPRRVFLGVGGFARDLVGTAYKDDDLSLRLRAAGAQCLWSPGIELYALDDDAPDHSMDQWARACQLIDRWRFVRKWVHAEQRTEMPS